MTAAAATGVCLPGRVPHLLAACWLCLAATLPASPVFGATAGESSGTFGPRGFAPATSAARTLDLEEYRGELVRLLAVARGMDGLPGVAAPLGEIPDTWHVTDGERRFVVRAAWLRDGLRAAASTGDADSRRKAVVTIERLLADLDRYRAAPPDYAGERRLRDRILARREFAGLHGPTWFDRLKQRATELLLRLLSRIFGSSSFPVVAATVVYALVALALLVSATWIYRTLRRTAVAPVVPDVVPVSAREWTAWLTDARRAADGADWRGAIHLAYWAGISYLESLRLWPPDRARTPREYLRLLPPDSQYRTPLSALTSAFEPVWYGRRPATAEEFSRTLADLEHLGCTSR
jgi:hypothetical protein